MKVPLAEQDEELQKLLKTYLESKSDPDDIDSQEINSENFQEKLVRYIDRMETLEKLNPMYKHN